MSIKNALDSLKMAVFPPSYGKWIDKSRSYGAELIASGSPVSSQWFPLDRLQFAPYDGKIINTNHRRIEEAPLDIRAPIS